MTNSKKQQKLIVKIKPEKKAKDKGVDMDKAVSLFFKPKANKSKGAK